MAKQELTFEPIEIGGHVREMKGSNGMTYRPVPVTGIKAIDIQDMPEGTVQAFVSVTNIEDDVQDIIEPGAYGATLKTRKPKGVWSHDWDTWVSKTISAVELMPNSMELPVEVKELNGGALFVTTQFNLNTQAGKDAYENVKFFADDCEWSIGYNVPPGGAKYDQKSGIRYIKQLDLFEYSPVLFGAMSMTSTLSVKSRFQREQIKVLESKSNDNHDENGRFSSGSGGGSSASPAEAREKVYDAADDAKKQSRAASEPDTAKYHADRAAGLNDAADEHAKGRSPSEIRDALGSNPDKSDGYNDGVEQGAKLLEGSKSATASDEKSGEAGQVISENDSSVNASGGMLSKGNAYDPATGSYGGTTGTPMMTNQDEEETKSALVDLHSKVARAKQNGSADAARSLGTALDHTEAGIEAGKKGDHPTAVKSFNRASGHADNAADSLGDGPLQTKSAEMADRLQNHAKSHLTAVVPGSPDSMPLDTSKGAEMLCDHCQKTLEAKVAKLEGKAGDASASQSDDPQVDCPICKGTGKVDGGKCDACDGTGKMPKSKADKLESNQSSKSADDDDDDDDDDTKAKKDDEQDVCPTCNGSGKVKNGTTTCPTCNGSGVVGETQEKAAKDATQVSGAVADAISQIDELVDKLMDALGIDDSDDDDDDSDEKSKAKDKFKSALHVLAESKKADVKAATGESKSASTSEDDALTEDELLAFENMKLSI